MSHEEIDARLSELRSLTTTLEGLRHDYGSTRQYNKFYAIQDVLAQIAQRITFLKGLKEPKA